MYVYVYLFNTILHSIYTMNILYLHKPDVTTEEGEEEGKINKIITGNTNTTIKIQ